MKKLFLAGSMFLFAFITKAQNVAVNSDGSTAASSAMLDVKSTTKGMLIPRMTSAQRAAIVSPVIGLMAFDTDTKTNWAYDGTAWKNLTGAASGGLTLPYAQTVAVTGSAFNVNNSGTAIEGTTTGNSSNAVKGTASTTSSNGVFGVNSSASGVGVRGEASGTGYGVLGYSTAGTGVAASSVSGYALTVSGKLKIAGGNTNPGAGSVLTSDASGNATWKAQTRSAFSVRKFNINNRNIPANSTTTVHLTTEEFDYGNNYAVYAGTTPAFGNSVFVAPKAGLYHFDAALSLEDGVSSSNEIKYVYMKIYIIRVVNGVSTSIDAAVAEFSEGLRGVSWMGEASISKDIKLVAGDIVQLQVVNTNTYPLSLNVYSNTDPHFGCHLIYED